MTRTRRSLVAVVLLVGLLTTGCGIPDRTDVVALGPGRSTGLSSGEDVTPQRNSRESSTDRAQFVANYLEAAAGDPEGALNRVRDFLSPATRRGFRPPQDVVRVVRLTEKPLVNLGSSTVLLRVQQVGILGRYGTLDPPVTDEGVTQTIELSVEEVEGQNGLFVTKEPSALLLSDTALDAFYQRRTIYFWNHDRTALVPDLRYLSSTVGSEQQPMEIIKWLREGPSPWLEPAVEALPEGTDLIGNVPAISDGKLQINLTGPAVPPDDPKAVDQLGRQLMWSLRSNLAQELELKIQNQVEATFRGTDYLTSNPAYRFTDEPERFCVFDGQVRRMTESVNPSAAVPVVTADVNRNVRSAALSNAGARTYAALVVADGKQQVLRVGSAVSGKPGAFRKAALPAPVGRPVWAITPEGADAGGAVGLVPAKGRIYSFGTGAAGPRSVAWQGGPSNVDAVAVAPDGHRVAVVAGGRLYLSVLTNADNGMQLSPPRQIRTLLGDLTAVDWSSEGSLLVAGLRADTARVAIMEVTIDGAVQTDRQADLGTARITYLVAYPANPVTNSEGANAVAYVADNVAYDVLQTPKRISVADIAGTVSNPPAGTLPTAPFFLN
jgi:hypothetical protein